MCYLILDASVYLFHILAWEYVKKDVIFPSG